MSDQYLCRYCGKALPSEWSSIRCPVSPDGQHRKGRDWDPDNESPMSAKAALRAGMVVGSLLRQGIDARPVLDTEGNYTSRIVIHLDGFGLFTIEVLDLRVTARSCPTCNRIDADGKRNRVTVGLVCQTCGWDYGRNGEP